MDDPGLLDELEPVAGHLAGAAPGQFPRKWLPPRDGALGPWADLRFAGETWDPQESVLGPGARRTALYVNLLTEDNLPFYFRTISERFGHDKAWGASDPTMDRRGRPPHDRDPRLSDRRFARGRSGGARAGADDSGDQWRRSRTSSVAYRTALVYVTLQELATTYAHANTGRLLDDKAGRRIMSRVAGDENLHYRFYRDPRRERGART